MSPSASLLSRIAAALLLATACATDDAATRTTVLDSAGVLIVQSRAAAWEAGEGWSVAQEPSVIIGAGDDEHQFHEIAAAIRLDAGMIVVADESDEHPVRFFDAAGRFVQGAGRRGEGPDEYRSIARLVKLGGDTLAVVDRDQRRITFLDSLGRNVGSFSYARVGAASPNGLVRLPDGSWVGAVSAFEAVPTTPGIHRMQAHLVRITPDGTGLDTVGVFAGSAVAFIEMGGRVAQGVAPYGRAFSFSAGGSQLYVGAGDALAVDVYSAAGELSRRMRGPDIDLALTAADMADYEAATLEAVPNDDARRAIEAYLSRLPRPERRAAYATILLDPEQNVWLGPHASPTRVYGPWRVFARSGEYLGEVTVPDRLRILEIGDDYVLGTWRDDLGVESVRVHALVK